MMPVATPPNAIIFGSGFVSVPRMAKAGSGLNILTIGIVTVFTIVVFYSISSIT